MMVIPSDHQEVHQHKENALGHVGRNLNVPASLTLFTMGYFKKRGEGDNLVVSYSIIQTLVYLNNLTCSLQNHQKMIKMTSLRNDDVIFRFRLPYPLKFRSSLFVHQFG